MSGGNGDVEIAVIVVIEDGDAAAGAGFIETNFARNVFEDHSRLFPAGFDFHAMTGGDKIRITAELLRGLPEPETGSSSDGSASSAVTAAWAASRILPGPGQGHSAIDAWRREVRRISGDHAELAAGILIEAAFDQHVGQLNPRAVIRGLRRQTRAVSLNYFAVFQPDEDTDFGVDLEEIANEFSRLVGPAIS